MDNIQHLRPKKIRSGTSSGILVDLRQWYFKRVHVVLQSQSSRDISLDIRHIIINERGTLGNRQGHSYRCSLNGNLFFPACVYDLTARNRQDFLFDPQLVLLLNPLLLTKQFVQLDVMKKLAIACKSFFT